MEKNFDKVLATKMGDILYLDEGKTKFIPSYLYYLLEYHGCNKVGFKTSSKLFSKEQLKGKDNWKDVK